MLKSLDYKGVREIPVKSRCLRGLEKECVGMGLWGSSAEMLDFLGDLEGRREDC